MAKDLQKSDVLKFILYYLKDDEFKKRFLQELAAAIDTAENTNVWEDYNHILSKWEAITEIELNTETQDALRNFEEECDNPDIYPLA